MISLPESVKILLWSEPVDMRKGFDGLAGLVRAAGEDALSGHLFVFLSKRRDRIKILMWHRGGFVLWYKRLERGSLRLPVNVRDKAQVALDSGQLMLMLEGGRLEQSSAPARMEAQAGDRQDGRSVIYPWAWMISV